MKIISKVTIHPMCYIIALICVLIGYFKPFLIVTSIILIHELGHIIMALILKWNIEKIIILPVGGLTKFNECLNRPIIEEFLIAISGPIFQIIFYFLFKDKFDLFYYHYLILAFNLIPVYPLDGSKILNLFFNKITNFKFSYLLTIKISYFIMISIILLSVIYKNLLITCIFLILLVQLYKEYKKLNYIFNKFCLERYLNDIYFKHTKIIKGNNIYKMKRDYYHFFYINGKFIKEKSYLNKYFE